MTRCGVSQPGLISTKAEEKALPRARRWECALKLPTSIQVTAVVPEEERGHAWSRIMATGTRLRQQFIFHLPSFPTQNGIESRAPDPQLHAGLWELQVLRGQHPGA